VIRLEGFATCRLSESSRLLQKFSCIMRVRTPQLTVAAGTCSMLVSTIHPRR
jgi:hypothetical protein